MGCLPGCRIQHTGFLKPTWLTVPVTHTPFLCLELNGFKECSGEGTGLACRVSQVKELLWGLCSDTNPMLAWLAEKSRPKHLRITAHPKHHGSKVTQS